MADYDVEAFIQKRNANKNTVSNANKQAADSMRSVGIGNIGGTTTTSSARDIQQRFGSSRTRGLGSRTDPVTTDVDEDVGGIKSFMDNVFNWFNSSGASEPKMPPSYDGSSVYERDEFKPQPTRFNSMVDMPSYEDIDAKIDEMFSKKGQPYKGIYESTYDEVKPQEGVEDYKARTAMASGINTAIKGIMDTEQRQSTAMRDAINKTIQSVMSDSPDVPYVIQAGDTLSEIAVKTGTTVKDLQELNNIEKADEIFTGNELIIPSAKSTKTKEDIVSSLTGGMGGVSELGSSFEGEGVETAGLGDFFFGKKETPQELTFLNNEDTTRGTRERIAYDAAYDAGLRGEELRAYMAQVSHESSNYGLLRELGYTSVASAVAVNGKKWENRLKRDNVVDPSDRDAETTGPVQENTAKNIFNSVYANRNGNGDFQSGDGFKYRGRGFIQLTGKNNYKQIGEDIGVDLENKPELMEDPEIAAKASAAWWKRNVRGKVPKNDYSNTYAVSGLVNTGSANKKANGLEDRKKLFNSYKLTSIDTSLTPKIRPKGLGKP